LCIPLAFSQPLNALLKILWRCFQHIGKLIRIQKSFFAMHLNGSAMRLNGPALRLNRPAMRVLLSVVEFASFEPTKPREVGFAKEMVEKKTGRECVGTSVGLESRRGEVRLGKKTAHAIDAGPLGFGKVGVVKDICKRWVPDPTARRSKLFFWLEGGATIENLDAVVVANDLHGLMDPVGTVHEGVDDSFSQGAYRKSGALRLEGTLLKPKASGNVR
jgi:hypothetical protein